MFLKFFAHSIGCWLLDSCSVFNVYAIVCTNSFPFQTMIFLGLDERQRKSDVDVNYNNLYGWSIAVATAEQKIHCS